MPNSTSAALAADHFLRISETERGERARRAGAGALVLRAVERAAAGESDAFGVRRARHEVERLDRSAEEGARLGVAAPGKLEPFEHLGDLHLGRPVDDEPEAAFVLVGQQEDDALVEERILHLRHREQ